MKKVVIIGGGLAGLSAGHHLQEYDPIVLEKEESIGGLCRSFTQDGFTFDCTGHLIHLKNQYTRDLLERILPDAFDPYDRRAAIYSKRTTTPYPFQANTFGLPPEVVKECVLGFVESMQAGGSGGSPNFRDWTLQTFGSGIAKHFMLPYNEKFWKQDLRAMTSDWVSWSIPKPQLEEVINGALGLTNQGMGYNPRFIYPKRGGIECLPQALARPIRQVLPGQTVAAIDAVKRVVYLATGREESYDQLVSTLPLPVVFGMLQDAPESLRRDAARLGAISVLNINLGIDRPHIHDQHWLYFPEEEFVFSRVGFPMNFSGAVAPAGTSSMYIEITHRPEQAVDVEEATAKSLAGLRKCGILQDGDRILTRHVLDIPHAYVVFDEHRRRCLPGLIDYLESRSIFTAGRYGRWDYYSMEDSILSGKAAADRIALRPLC